MCRNFVENQRLEYQLIWVNRMALCCVVHNRSLNTVFNNGLDSFADDPTLTSIARRRPGPLSPQFVFRLMAGNNIFMQAITEPDPEALRDPAVQFRYTQQLRAQIETLATEREQLMDLNEQLLAGRRRSWELGGELLTNNGLRTRRALTDPITRTMLPDTRVDGTLSSRTHLPMVIGTPTSTNPRVDPRALEGLSLPPRHPRAPAHPLSSARARARAPPATGSQSPPQLSFRPQPVPVLVAAVPEPVRAPPAVTTRPPPGPTRVPPPVVPARATATERQRGDGSSGQRSWDTGPG